MTTIGELGEDALIAAFAPRLPTTDAELLGPGDDAAVISVDGDLVVSSDVLVEGRHFRLDWSTGEDVGWRAAVQNLADIDAMGAVPTALQVTLAAPASTPVAWVLAFADGLRLACEPHGVGVVGGDLSGASEIHIGVTALGETHGIDPITRADAVPGDVVAVSAPLGAAAAGLALLEAGITDGEAVAALQAPTTLHRRGPRGGPQGRHGHDGHQRRAACVTRRRIARASDVALDIASRPGARAPRGGCRRANAEP